MKIEKEETIKIYCSEENECEEAIDLMKNENYILKDVEYIDAEYVSGKMNRIKIFYGTRK